jgi:hypothetical protein
MVNSSISLCNVNMATSEDIDLTREKGVNICCKIKPGKNKKNRAKTEWLERLLCVF